jgi:hypothetical protein
MDAAAGRATTTSLTSMQDNPNMVVVNEHGRQRRPYRVTFSTNLNFLSLIFDIFR